MRETRSGKNAHNAMHRIFNKDPEAIKLLKNLPKIVQRTKERDKNSKEDFKEGKSETSRWNGKIDYISKKSVYWSEFVRYI